MVFYGVEGDVCVSYVSAEVAGARVAEVGLAGEFVEVCHVLDCMPWGGVVGVGVEAGVEEG